MALVDIDSIDDPRILVYRDMPRSSLPRHCGLFLAEGRLLVESLLDSDYAVESILVDASQLDTWRSVVPDSVPTFVVDHTLVKQLVGYNFHRGIIACGRRKPGGNLVELGLANRPRAHIVMCIRVHDPENLGGIIRNCAAFGVDAVVLSSQCCDPFSRRVLRVSMGTVWNLPIVQSTELDAEYHELKREGFEFTATILDESATPIDEFRRPPRQALLFGNEAHGLEPAWIPRCDHRVTIPMRGNVDSLNVSVASGICLYQMFVNSDQT